MVRGRLLLLGRPAGAPGCWMVGPRTDAAGVPVLAVLDMAPFLVIALAGLLLRVGSSRRDLDGGGGSPATRWYVWAGLGGVVLARA